MTPANAELHRVLVEAKQTTPRGRPRQTVALKELRMFGGVLYASKAEADFAAALTRGLIPMFVGHRWWTRQETFELSPKRSYTADFLIQIAGDSHVVEVKGGKVTRSGDPAAFWHPEARLRWEWCQQRYPDFTYSVWVPSGGRLVKVEG